MMNLFSRLFPSKDLTVRLPYIFEEDMACLNLRSFEAEAVLAPRFLIEWTDKYLPAKTSHVQKASAAQEALSKIADLMRDAAHLSADEVRS